MARFDRPCMTFYQSAIVAIALSCTICELFDLEIWHRGHSRSLNFVKMFDAGKTRMIGLPYGERTMTIC